MSVNLPAELWLQIFQWALDEYNVFSTTLPTALSQSWWSKGLGNKWILRTPLDVMSVVHRQRNSLLRAIVSTCHFWRQVGSEFLFQYVYMEDPASISRLCRILEKDRNPGLWIKKLHVARFHERLGFTFNDLQLGLVSTIRLSRRLNVFIMERPLKDTFSPVMDALSTYCARYLQTLQIHVPQKELAKLIWTLDVLPNLVSLHLEFMGNPMEEPCLGSASNIVLTLPNLQQLSLRGFYSDFLEQAIDWNLPSIESLSLDFTTHRDDLPDLLEFLRLHGTCLSFLDINCLPEQDIRPILDLCPNLHTFAFNADWRLPADDTLQPHDFSASALVRHPHPKITTIGLHGMLYAFGVGPLAEAPMHVTSFHRMTNEMNFAALKKRNFPKLENVRLLSPSLLQDLEAANGPKGEFMERWRKWWVQCNEQNIRLEDCTGALLGYLPQDEDDETETELETEVSDSLTTITETTVRDPIERIRVLTERCRQMTAALQYPYLNL